MSEAIKPSAIVGIAAAPSAEQPHPSPSTPAALPIRDAWEAGTDNVDDAARLAMAALPAPVLPDIEGPFAPRSTAAGVALDGLAYRQRHLAEAVHILTELAGARMDSAGRAKVRYAQSEAMAALQAAELELKEAKAGRRAAWVGAGANLVSQGSQAVTDPATKVALTMLGQAVNVLDKTYGFQRTVDDAKWRASYIRLRERLSKQMEDMQGNEYEKAMRLLERSLETTRQMASNNTDTVRAVSQNL